MFFDSFSRYRCTSIGKINIMKFKIFSGELITNLGFSCNIVFHNYMITIKIQGIWHFDRARLQTYRFVSHDVETNYNLGIVNLLNVQYIKNVTKQDTFKFFFFDAKWLYICSFMFWQCWKVMRKLVDQTDIYRST